MFADTDVSSAALNGRQNSSQRAAATGVDLDRRSLEDLVRRYDLSGPRYTSYPPSPQFRDFTPADWHDAMAQSNRSDRPLSLYFHIPFCDTVCYYCGCNKIITANRKRAVRYLEYLCREMSLQSRQLDRQRPVRQLHLGGGTPTYLDDLQITQLMAYAQACFDLADDDSAEISIEIHPQTVDVKRLENLRRVGFNRLSLGIQDFDPAVQAAVNRFNTAAEVAELISAARRLHYRSVSFDLIYGLPKQDRASFGRTLEQVIALRPDRLSLFNYAHMPHLFKTQKQIDAKQLPEPQEKLSMLCDSIERLQTAGYCYIGMDHFALPDDELTRAQSEGTLHRNFQGYSTGEACELLAFGVSAIGHFGNCFAQNAKELTDYEQALQNNQLPVVRGMTLSWEDRLRAAVIQQMICHFHLDFARFEQQWQISFRDYFASALAQLEPLAHDGLLQINADGIRVSDLGRLLIRRICMAFDAYLSPSAATNIATPRYSRII